MSIFDKLKEGVICSSAEETMNLAESLCNQLPSNQVVALSGDLGSGKTTFTKGFGRALGIPEESITSPTFNIYTIHEGRLLLVHIDAYRLASEDAMEELLIDEFLNDSWLIVVEWPERGLASWMDEQLWKLSFSRKEDGIVEISLGETPATA